MTTAPVGPHQCAVRLLQQHTAPDAAELIGGFNRFVGGGFNGEQPKVLLTRQNLQGVRTESRSNDRFNEQLRQFLGCRLVEGLIKANH